MGWRDRFGGDKPPEIAAGALERIRAATAASDEPKSKWDELSTPTLEVYAATETALQPHADAGTLPGDMLLPNGRHVGGVHFHPYAGAGEAWRDRTRRGFLIQDGKFEGDTYYLTNADIERIKKHTVDHAAELFTQRADENIAAMKGNRDEMGWAGANETLKFWFRDAEHQELFSHAMRDALDETFDKKEIRTTYDLSSWFDKAATVIDDTTYGLKNVSDSKNINALPKRMFADVWNGGFIKDALRPVVSRTYQEQKQLQSLQTPMGR